MPRFGFAGCRWAQARGNSQWAQMYNRQFRTMSAGAYLMNTCEYFPLAHGSGRAFPENSITGNAVRMLMDAEAEGLGAAASLDEAVAAYLSGLDSGSSNSQSFRLLTGCWSNMTLISGRSTVIQTPHSEAYGF